MIQTLEFPTLSDPNGIMAKTRKHQTGFSLIELVLVMMIIGIITVITIPKVFGIIGGVTEKAVAERLIEDLSYLRNYAIANHDTTWLVVDAAQNQWGLYSGPSALSRSLLADPLTGESLVLDLDDDYSGVTISSVSFGGSAEVSFNYWGVPSSGGTVELSNIRTITLIAETGMVHETP